MANILKMGKYSYQLQEAREESLINQSGYMITAYAVASALFSLIIPKTLNIGLIIFITSLIISLVFAVLASWRFKYTPMIDIDVIFNEVYDRWEEYQTQAAFDMQWKYQISALHKAKKKRNDLRARCILISMSSFMCSLIIATFLIWRGLN